MKDEKKKKKASERLGDSGDDVYSDVSASDLESDSEDFDEEEEEEDKDEAAYIDENRHLRRRRGGGEAGAAMVQANSMAATKKMQGLDKGMRQLIGETGAQHKELDLGIAMMQHLLVAADRFDLGRLRAICETKLCETIDLESVIGTLVLAERNHAPNLKQACLQYVASNLSILLEQKGTRKCQ